ncbi:MAG TPA: RNA polymerase sigma factor [Myxococcales bacterium]|nr:RNA polymerase sigma factor [Myxococcales bacterium]
MQRTNRLCGRPLNWAPDETLLELSQRGDADAYVSLTTRHWDTVCRVAWNMLPSTAQAGQVARATFLAVRNSREAFPRGVPFMTSLYRVVLGECWRRLRDAPVPPLPDRTAASRIREMLLRLDSLDRAAFVLRQIEEVSLTDAAAILGIGPASIRERTHRATMLLMGVVAGGDESGARSFEHFISSRNQRPSIPS